MSELLNHPCPHCLRRDVCKPCSDGNPPYTRTAPSVDRKIREQVEHQLTAIPDLYSLLGGFREPGSAPPDPDARRGTTNPSRPTVRLDVVDLTDERYKTSADDPGYRDLELDRLAGSRRLGILPTLSLWVMLIDSELRDTGWQGNPSPEPPTVAGECLWLADHLDWALDKHSDIAEELKWMHKDLQRACGIRPPEQAFCPKCTNRVEGRDGDTWFQCTGCNQTWTMGAEIQRLFALQPPMTLPQIAAVLGIPTRTLYNWEAEGRFMPVKPDPRFRLAIRRAGGAKVYDIEHVKRAAVRTATLDK